MVDRRYLRLLNVPGVLSCSKCHRKETAVYQAGYLETGYTRYYCEDCLPLTNFAQMEETSDEC